MPRLWPRLLCIVLLLPGITLMIPNRSNLKNIPFTVNVLHNILETSERVLIPEMDHIPVAVVLPFERPQHWVDLQRAGTRAGGVR